MRLRGCTGLLPVVLFVNDAHETQRRGRSSELVPERALQQAWHETVLRLYTERSVSVYVYVWMDGWMVRLYEVDQRCCVCLYAV